MWLKNKPRIMKKILSLLLVIEILASCSIERRRYLPGFHIEGRGSNNMSWQAHASTPKIKASNTETPEPVISSPIAEAAPLCTSDPSQLPQQHLAQAPPLTSPLTTHPSPLSPDTLKKPFKPQKQYREIDPVGRASVIVVLAGVSLQKIAGILTWFEVIMPLSFGPGVFIPAFAVTLVGLIMSVYSAYRVRKYPEKYKKNEWGKAALAILGWQIIMSVLFAWLLGGLPIL